MILVSALYSYFNDWSPFPACTSPQTSDLCYLQEFEITGYLVQYRKPGSAS